MIALLAAVKGQEGVDEAARTQLLTLVIRGNEYLLDYYETCLNQLGMKEETMEEKVQLANELVEKLTAFQG